MKKDALFKNFIKTLNDRIPQRGKLPEVLTELLGIEKEAVYRRLRGSVPFSFQEVHKIAHEFGFSLDSIAESISTHTWQMTALAIEFLEPQEKDFKMLESFAEGLYRVKEDPDSETGAIGSTIPSTIYAAYEYIYKFYLYKWAHQFWNSKRLKTYAETKVSERMQDYNREFVKNMQNSPKKVYILDRQFIEYFVNDVKFFFDIRLLTEDDVLRLKEDLHRLINDLDRFARNGCFDNGNKVEFFLSNVHLEADYYYIDATHCKLTIMRSFAFKEFYSFDEVIFQDMKNWLIFLKRTSTLISEGNIPERIKFFEQQKKLVDSM